MSYALAIAGASIFLLLGIMHAVITVQSSPAGGPLMPTDPTVRAAMSTRGGLGLAPDLDTTLYRAWIGFNLSHSLGVIAMASIVLAQVLTDFTAATEQLWFLAIVIAVPTLYLVLAIRYWFDKPRDGIALGAMLLWAGVLIESI